MRKQLLAVLMAVLPIPAVAFQASSSGRMQRGRPQTEDVFTIVRDLSDKSQDLWNSARQNRNSSSAELHMNVGAFAGTALAMSDKAEYNANDPAFRAGARRLVDLARGIDREIGRGPLADEWKSVQMHLARLSDRYSLGYNPPGLSRRPYDLPGQDRVGQEHAPVFRWRGRVDGTDQIVVKGDRVSIQHLRFNPIRDSSYDLPQPLPSRNMELRLRKLQGRGKIEIVNQPNASNDYSVTILVEDADPGNDFYEFELIW